MVYEQSISKDCTRSAGRVHLLIQCKTLLFFASVRGGRLVMNSISNRSLGVSVTSGVICALGIIFIGISAFFFLETEVSFEGSGTSSRELPGSLVGTLRESA